MAISTEHHFRMDYYFGGTDEYDEEKIDEKSIDIEMMGIIGQCRCQMNLRSRSLICKSGTDLFAS